jgi:multiple sugar transport system substrate-binding protein
VVGLYSYNIPQFAESRAVLALDGFDLSVYAPAVRKLLTYQGKQWAGVNTIYNLALYYNKALFLEAGMPRPPRTVNELDEAAGRLDVRGPGGKLERVGFLPNMPGWWPYSWPVNFGGRLYDAATDTAEFADAPTVAAYEWIAGYPKRVGLDASREFGNSFGRSYHTAMDPFMTGRAAMIVQGPWLASFIRLYAPALDYGAVPVPVAAGLEDGPPRGLVEADVLMIPRGCKQPEAALEFVRYMQRREVQERLALDHGKSSPMEDVSRGFFEGHPNREVQVHDAITRSPLVQVLPQTRAWQQYADMTIGAFDRVWQGENVPRVLSEVQRRAQELIDLAAVRRRQRAGA